MDCGWFTGFSYRDSDLHACVGDSSERWRRAEPARCLHPSDTTNYNNALGDATINVLKATPTVTWANPADITYGTDLSGTQLNATFTWVVNGSTVTVTGTATYTPASGTVLNAGAGQNLHVGFTPTDTTNYNNTSGDATINVLKANTDRQLDEPSGHCLRHGAERYAT